MGHGAATAIRPSGGALGQGKEDRSRGRRLLVPALLTVLMLAILIGLGVWQLQRRTWKLGLLAAIDHAEAAPAIPLPEHPTSFAKVRIEGHMQEDRQAFYGADVRDLPSGPTMGARLVEPMDRPGADPVLVDRGWLPTGAHPAPAPSVIEGYVRAPETPGAFSATDNPGQHLFYTLNPAAIGKALGLARVAPFTLVALGPVVPGVFPQPATALPRPPNDHLNYAITWFSLAATLAVIFTLYARKVLRA
jgi:surfeit locus 1 family protein